MKGAAIWHLGGLLLIVALDPAVTAASEPPPADCTRWLEAARPAPAGEAERARLATYLARRGVAFQGWLHSGKMLLRREVDGLDQLFTMTGPGQTERRLSHTDYPILQAWSAPEARSDQFVYAYDTDGDERYRLVLFDPESGTGRRLTGEGERAGAPRFGRRGNALAHYLIAAGQNDWHLVVHDFRRDRQVVLVDEPGAWLPFDWPLTSDWLLALLVKSPGATFPYLIHSGDGLRLPLYPENEQSAYSEGIYSPRLGKVYLVSDRGREFFGLFAVDLFNQVMKLELPDLLHDIERIAANGNRRRLAMVSNVNGRSRLEIRRLPGMKALSIPDLPAGVIDDVQFDADGRRLGFTLAVAARPPEAWSLTLKTGQLERWAGDERSGAAAASEPQDIAYPTFDSNSGPPRQIQAWYYPPPPDRSPAPVIVVLHGGPEVQARPVYDPLVEYWRHELGLAVIAPNVRGSRGYGRSFLALDNGRLREDAVRDVGALLDWIAGRAELDAGRVALYGASYGGYLTLAASIRYGPRVRAAVELFGISDFVTFLEETGDFRRDLRRAEYGDERDPEMRDFLQRISPLSRVGEIVSPLFVAQGGNDIRVPQRQSDELVCRLAAGGKPVRYLLAADEGHGFRKPENQLRLYAGISDFLRQWLLAPGPRPAAVD